VNLDRRFDRLLRWYPPSWRERYGDGMIALLEDAYAQGAVPWRVRLSLARTGLVERFRASGLVGASTGRSEQLRAGSLLVLCAWSAFVVAGSIFAKFSEHWSSSTPPLHRSLASVGYHIVEGAGAFGAVVVAVAALLALPPFIALLRSGGWSSLRRPLHRVAIAGAAIAVLTAALVIWAHALSSHDRNGALVPYEAAFLFWSAAVVVAIAVTTGSVVAVVGRLDFSYRKIRMLSAMALALVASMMAVFAGVVLWWVQEASAAPHFLANNIGDGIVATSRLFPPAMIVASLLMVLGLAAATGGVTRLTRSLHAKGGPAPSASR
jgi:hypothetical protein